MSSTSHQHRCSKLSPAWWKSSGSVSINKPLIGSHMTNQDPVAAFHQERAEHIAQYERDEGFKRLSQDWLRESMARRYVYNFDWMGRPIIQYPQDMVAMQELIWTVKPDL